MVEQTELESLMISVAHRVPSTEAEGPGRRYALWVQGCPLRCPGCCNPEMLEFREEQPKLSVAQVWEEISATRAANDSASEIEGITLLGGEPFSHALPLSRLAEQVQQTGMSVMIFSGFTLERLKRRRDPEVQRLLAHTDLLVDGPYVREQAVSNRRWIGSANQRAHFLSTRYRSLQVSPQRWDPNPNTIEIRWKNGELQVNGFPHSDLGQWTRDQNSQTPP